MLKQLKRIVYPVSDLAEAKGWYSDLLGYPPIFDAPFAAIFTVGSCSLSLTPANDSAPHAAGPPVYWEVDDVETALARLLEKGATVHMPLRAALGIRTASVIDPYGNLIGLTDQGEAAQRQAVDRKPSETALTVAFSRALAALEGRPELKGPDSLAEIFLNPEAKVLLKTADTRIWAIQNLVTAPLYGYFLARTAWLDQVFAAACRDGIAQIVFLGAGYDTRAIRHRALIQSTRIFELDMPTTQQRKLALLREHGIETPPAVTYVPIDFERTPILTALAAAGYDPAWPTLFIWEGVSYYLSQESVEATLAFVAEHSGAGSRLSLDILTTRLESVNPAEPFRFWMHPEAFASLLAKHGLRPVEFVSPSDMAARFLTFGDGSQQERCLSTFCLLTAEKAGG